jgi:hypothetical protein
MFTSLSEMTYRISEGSVGDENYAFIYLSRVPLAARGAVRPSVALAHPASGCPAIKSH